LGRECCKCSTSTVRSMRHFPGFTFAWSESWKQARSGRSTLMNFQRRPRRLSQGSMTLLELIIACSILLILSSAELPLVRRVVVREREKELRQNLREIRDAIDRYKDYADRNLIRQKADSEGYPPDLETLVQSVHLGGSGYDRKVRFLRRIPLDPMTGRAEWGL